MNSSKHYDYIIAGAGASGLSLAWHLVESTLKDKRILLIDVDLTPANNKTWCFWHKGTPPFQKLIHKEWNHAEVFVKDAHISEELRQYPYYCIRSVDFKNFILEKLRTHPSVDLLEASIQQIIGHDKQPMLKTDTKSFTARYIFQSCFIPPQFKSSKIQYPLIQSFYGYDIETQQRLFEPDTFTLMDFDDTYNGGLAFMYLLPWSETDALVEYTIFSTGIEEERFYQQKIELYLNNKFGLKRIDYHINRTEYGEIPMQDLPYAPWYQPGVMNLGAAGGLIKPSTGYTFSRIQQHSNRIVEQLKEDGSPALPYRSPFRYRAYDLWLLQIMHDHPEEALEVFQQLFSNNQIDQVFKFLAEESTFTEDLKIMNSVPYLPFLRAMRKTRKRLFDL